MIDSSRIVIKKAKNGSNTCSINDVLLHSSYNPDLEGERFVQNLIVPFNPDYLLIVEPCLDYISKSLNNKYPNAKLIAIRFTHEFDNFNTNFDKVVYFTNEAENIKDSILNYCKEEGLCKAFIISLPASSKAFNDVYLKTMQILKELLEYSRTILITNSVFERRWFTNFINFYKLKKDFFTIKKTNAPVVITASGVSLENTLPSIKKYRNNFYLVALSSSLSCLLNNKIIPDLVLSTDGGYWAKNHLTPLIKNKNIPIAISSESNCPSKILKQNPIIPLLYSDSNEIKILKEKIKTDNFIQAKRNGTVSGTAIEMILNLTTGNIFVCGLDLAPNKGKQHTEPNLNEVKNAITENLLKSKEKTSTLSRFNSQKSLKIYNDWFCTNSINMQNRVFRLSDNFHYSNTLGYIKDVNISFFEKSVHTSSLPPFYSILDKKEDFNINELKQEINTYIKNNCNTEDWFKKFFPFEYISYQRLIDIDEKKSLLDKIQNKNNIFMAKIKRILDENI